jgi:predicted DNA-binding protein
VSPDPRVPSVEAIVGGVRRHLARRLLLVSMVWAAASVALVLLLAVGLAGSGWERGRWVPLALDLSVVAALLGLGLTARRFARSSLAEGRVTRAMEVASSLPAGSVQGALELGRGVPPGVSGSLAAAAERSVAGGLGGETRGLAGTLESGLRRWLGRGSGVLALLGTGVVLVAVLLPHRSVAAWRGLATPVALVLTPALPPLEVMPGSIEILRGAPLDIRVRAPLRERVTLRWTSPGEVPGETVQEVVGDGATFRFAEVTGPLVYWVETPDGSRSARYTVTPVDPLFLSEVRLELIFPPHTGRLPEELRGEIPLLTVPVGTRIQVEGSGSRELAEAGLEPEDGGSGSEVLQVAGSRFSGLWIPRRDGRYRWRLRDEGGGAPAVEPPPLDVVLVPDSVPFVRMAFPGQDTILPPGFRQPLVVEARDDYGVAGVEIVAWRVSASGQGEDPRTQRLDVAGSRAVLVRPTLDVSRWGLSPGDEVRYYARALDNAPASQAGRTPEYVLRVPGASEIRDDTRNRLDDAARRLEELAAQAGEQGDRTRDLERQAAAGAEQGSRPARGGDTRSNPMDFQQREDIRQAMEEQQGLVSSVDSLQSEISELMEGLREAGMLDPGLREDLRELQSLLDEVASPEMQERLSRLSEALERNTSPEIQDALEQMTEAQNEFRQRLEESLERFRRAAAEQELRSATAEAQELAMRQEAVAEALERGDNVPLRGEQQAQMARDAEALAERMERVEERLERAGEPEAAEAARSAGQQASQARESMERASREASAGRQEQAAEAGQEAAEALRAAADELQRSQEEMQQQMEDAVADALQRTADDALALSRRQGELRERMRGASAETRTELRADEQALMQGVNNLAQNLAASSQGSSDVDRQVGTAMGQAMQAIQQTMDALEGQAGRTPSPLAGAEQAINALNEVARLSMDNARRIRQEGGEGADSAEDLQEQLEALAQQQGQLNAQSGQMMPLQLGSESMQGQMQQIAQGQEAVAGELGNLASQPGANEQALGDLEALAREAEALARELAGGRLEPETLRRQERLFQRLLDAGRTLEQEEEQEESEEREGRAAGAVERGVVQPLDPGSTGFRYALPGSAELQRLPPAQRQLVLEYFERLNRMETPPTPPPGGRR